MRKGCSVFVLENDILGKIIWSDECIAVACSDAVWDR
jgi:hypothetical protein